MWNDVISVLNLLLRLREIRGRNPGLLKGIIAAQLPFLFLSHQLGGPSFGLYIIVKSGIEYQMIALIGDSYSLSIIGVELTFRRL